MNCINKICRLALIFFGFAVLLSACGSAPTQNGGPGNINPRARLVEIPDAAKNDYQKVLQAIDKKNWSAAQSLLEQMQTAYPKLVSVNTMLGWTYWQAGKIEQAQAQLLAVTETRNLYKPDAFKYLAVIYREQGEFIKAEKLYKKALGTWPRDTELYKNLGILYELYLGRLNDALGAYKQAQAIDGKDKQLNGWVKDLERRT